MEFAPQSGISTYQVNLKLPIGVECERCVLQWTYITANSRDAYPEAFWNCADVSVCSDPATCGNQGPQNRAPSPVLPTPGPTRAWRGPGVDGGVISSGASLLGKLPTSAELDG